MGDVDGIKQVPSSVQVYPAGQSSSLQHSVLQEGVVVGSGVGVVGLMQFPSSLQTYPAGQSSSAQHSLRHSSTQLPFSQT